MEAGNRKFLGKVSPEKPLLIFLNGESFEEVCASKELKFIPKWMFKYDVYLVTFFSGIHAGVASSNWLSVNTLTSEPSACITHISP